MQTDDRYALFIKLIEVFDVGCKYVNDYNAMLHDYNGTILYQAESQFINMIGRNPGITITELSLIYYKSVSACSQLMRRMKNKGWIYQQRNQSNNREYKLYLTEEGKVIYHNHLKFEEACYQRACGMLDEFCEEQLKNYIAIQEQLNSAFLMDVEESRSISGNSLD
ncbi:MarR family winged helix-turn-helix transcriptional regulator [Lacrimispora brassicae]